LVGGSSGTVEENRERRGYIRSATRAGGGGTGGDGRGTAMGTDSGDDRWMGRTTTRDAKYRGRSKKGKKRRGKLNGHGTAGLTGPPECGRPPECNRALVPQASAGTGYRVRRQISSCLRRRRPSLSPMDRNESEYHPESALISARCYLECYLECSVWFGPVANTSPALKSSHIRADCLVSVSADERG
jgi:hypothetical protein